MIELGPNRYGKSQIRLVKVTRGADRHSLRDLTVAIALEGDFEAAHTEGDNASVVATDTMKNTTYVLAKDGLTGSIEAFGRQLAAHFGDFPQVSLATASIREHAWRPIDTSAGPAADAFVRGGEGTRTAKVTCSSDAFAVESGIDDLVVMKTTKSAFEGFPRDRYTTLPEASDRLMATKISVSWGYGAAAANDAAFDFDRAFETVRSTLLDSFATHFSPSVQNSVWVMGSAILEAAPDVDWVHMALPNLHHWLVDLGPFGLTNDRELYIATTEPHGLIEATVRRAG
ncbi:MAG TPA: urate oxidase [Candidatus Polarisedimenticolia bacterium]|nr:urate oxidase [Candidatus Polarisedimenticolia bacterium]